MTAVEWFAIQILYRPNLSMTEKLDFLNEAKGMEKKQVIETAKYYFHERGKLTPEQYYNETFKSE